MAILVVIQEAHTGIVVKFIKNLSIYVTERCIGNVGAFRSESIQNNRGIANREGYGVGDCLGLQTAFLLAGGFHGNQMQILAADRIAEGFRNLRYFTQSAQNVAFRIQKGVAIGFVFRGIITKTIMAGQDFLRAAAQSRAGITQRKQLCLKFAVFLYPLSFQLIYCFAVQVQFCHNEKTGSTSQRAQQRNGTQEDSDELENNMITHQIPPSIL